MCNIFITIIANYCYTRSRNLCIDLNWSIQNTKFMLILIKYCKIIIYFNNNKISVKISNIYLMSFKQWNMQYWIEYFNWAYVTIQIRILLIEFNVNFTEICESY